VELFVAIGADQEFIAFSLCIGQVYITQVKTLFVSRISNAPHKGSQLSAAFWLSQRPTGAIAADC